MFAVIRDIPETVRDIWSTGQIMALSDQIAAAGPGTRIRTEKCGNCGRVLLDNGTCGYCDRPPRR